MLHSMTAFARTHAQGDWGTATWELRSVNSRYLDLTFKIPERLRDLEPKCRETLQKALARGKVEASLRFQAGPAALPNYTVNEPYLAQLLTAANSINEKVDGGSVSVMHLLQWPGVLREEAADITEMQQHISNLFEQAISVLQNARAAEGEAIRPLFTDRINQMRVHVEEVSQHLPDIRQQHDQQLRERLAEVTEKLDQQRLEQELVHFAQRMDVSEEIDRLHTHLNEIERIIKKGGTVGRRLDFLMQELNREANTLASKSASTTQSHAAVELKVLIEQIREQVQNIE